MPDHEQPKYSRKIVAGQPDRRDRAALSTEREDPLCSVGRELAEPVDELSNRAELIACALPADGRDARWTI
jgi:hypothetical protein